MAACVCVCMVCVCVVWVCAVYVVWEQYVCGMQIVCGVGVYHMCVHGGGGVWMPLCVCVCVCVRGVSVRYGVGWWVRWHAVGVRKNSVTVKLDCEGDDQAEGPELYLGGHREPLKGLEQWGGRVGCVCWEDLPRGCGANGWSRPGQGQWANLEVTVMVTAGPRVTPW